MLKKKFIEGFNAKCVKPGTWMTVGEEYPIDDVGIFKVCVLTPQGPFWHRKNKLTPVKNPCPACRRELDRPLPQKEKDED